MNPDYGTTVLELPIPDYLTVKGKKVYWGDAEVGDVSERIPGYMLMRVCGYNVIQVEK
jgi:hypothetical protein